MIDQLRLVVANLHDDPRALAQSLPHADYLICNEARTRAIRAIRNLPTSVYGSQRWAGAGRQNPHVWRHDVVEAYGIARGATLTKGGRIGLAEVRSRVLRRRYRRRRLGPGRAMTARRIRLGEHGTWMVGVHLPARWMTSERWRRFLIRRVVMPRARRFVRKLRATGAEVCIGGDMNAAGLGDVVFGSDMTIVHTRADMGARHYTQVHITPGLRASSVSELHTASDHDAPTMVLHTR